MRAPGDQKHVGRSSSARWQSLRATRTGQQQTERHGTKNRNWRCIPLLQLLQLLLTGLNVALSAAVYAV